MYKQPTIPSVSQISLPLRPKTDSMGIFGFSLVCPSIPNKARDSFFVAYLTFSRRLDGRAQTLPTPRFQSTVLPGPGVMHYVLGVYWWP
eukprot:scaffold16238_cov36-Phaeocystis_antarctica.AAC.1